MLEENKLFKIQESKSFYAWAEFLTIEGSVNFESSNVSIHFLGEGDKSYLVVDIMLSNSPNKVDEYVFHPVSEENKLFSLFKFLETMDFDILKIVNYLKSAEFESDEYSEVFQNDLVRVAKYTLTENKGTIPNGG